jgi:hypothetical protein
VGWDDSGLSQLLLGIPSIYYVGIVWQNDKQEGSDTKTDVMFTGLLNFIYMPPTVYSLTHAAWAEYNVFPQIEIEPIENWHRLTTVVWTYTKDENPPSGYFEDATLHTLDTNWILHKFFVGEPWDPLVLFPEEDPDNPIGRNGFPTYAAQVSDDPTFGYGYLAWLHDDWPNNPAIKVWAGDLIWDKSEPGNVSSENPEEISEGLSSINPPFVFGPEIAIIGSDQAKCIWTDSEPGDFGIYGDTSDA